MAACTFFGHRDAPKEIEPTLQSTLIDLIENKGVINFYVGNNGNFDFMVEKNLKNLKVSYPHINYNIVLAYLPKKKDYNNNTIYPEGLETPPKYAIVKRNRWMVDNSDYIVTYVIRTFGGAAQFKAFAENKGKIVLNITDN